jgi:hypothetical protein
MSKGKLFTGFVMGVGAALGAKYIIKKTGLDVKINSKIDEIKQELILLSQMEAGVGFDDVDNNKINFSVAFNKANTENKDSNNGCEGVAGGFHFGKPFSSGESLYDDKFKGPDGNIDLSKMRGEQPDASQTTEKTESDVQTEVAADKAEETTEQEKPEASAEAEAEAEASEDDTVEAPEDAAAEEPEVSQDKTSDVEDWMESEGVSKDDLEKHLKNTGLDKES